MLNKKFGDLKDKVRLLPALNIKDDVLEKAISVIVEAAGNF